MDRIGSCHNVVPRLARVLSCSQPRLARPLLIAKLCDPMGALQVDFVRRWSEKTEIGVGRFIHWLSVTASKFYDWRERYGCVNEHNGWVPRDFWLDVWEKEAIIDFHLKNPLEGYRRLTFMMLDADVVAVSPTSVWRVLKQAGLLSGKPSHRARGPVSSSRSSRINIGISMSPTLTSAGPSITCAVFWMGTVVLSCIGTCVSRCGRPTSR
jgi:hypothetical protein